MDAMATRGVLADREHRYAGAPAWIVFRALTDARARWLRLHPGEVLPKLLEAVPNQRVVWSSFWPVSPDDTIELTLTEDRGSTNLRLVWRTSAPPDERGIGITRQRLNTKLGGDIRGWLASEEAWKPTAGKEL
jgi:hypothetical protein